MVRVICQKCGSDVELVVKRKEVFRGTCWNVLARPDEAEPPENRLYMIWCPKCSYGFIVDYPLSQLSLCETDWEFICKQRPQIRSWFGVKGGEDGGL